MIDAQLPPFPILDQHTQRPHSFMLLIEDYNRAYSRAVSADPQLRQGRYDERMRRIFERAIYYGDSYSVAFASQGQTAAQIIPMCQPLQYRWAAEHGLLTPPHLLSRNPFRWAWRRYSGRNPQDSTLMHILTAQIRQARPDVLWVFSGIPLRREDLLRWRDSVGTMMLWWSCPINPRYPYDQFDLILSCIRPLVDEFRSRGLRAQYLAHAFDARLAQRLATPGERARRVVFVGNLSAAHQERITFLDGLAREVELVLYGVGIEQTPLDSVLRAAYHGPAWGDELYKVYRDNLIVIHKNVDVAGSAASAKRLFEATGMGACVVAEASDDLARLFTPGEEIVTYTSFAECVAKVKHLLANPQEAERIGRRGQQRTLSEHSYERRVAQINGYLEEIQR